MVGFPDDISESHIKTSFAKGDILYWENYEGAEETKNRYFILLTSCIEKMFLAANATSQIKFYNDGRKRNDRDFILVESGESTFPKDTIIDLNWIENFSVKDMAKILGSGISKQGCLSDEYVKSINQRVSESKAITKIRKQKILGNYEEK